jgi:hypothetical protein
MSAGDTVSTNVRAAVASFVSAVASASACSWVSAMYSAWVGVRPVQLGGYSPCVVLQCSVAEEPDAQPTDIVENLAADPFIDLATVHRFVQEGERLRAQQRGSRQAVLRWNGRFASGEVDGHRCIDDEYCHTSTFAWTAGVPTGLSGLIRNGGGLPASASSTETSQSPPTSKLLAVPFERRGLTR